MLALIMAGGAGSRLNQGEKPLLLIAGRPMISWVADAFCAAGCEPVIVTTPKTPMTQNWSRAQGFAIHRGSGNGFIEDMVGAVLELGESHPLFVSVSDIPGISSATIRIITDKYNSSGKDACSIWVPSTLAGSSLESMPYRETIKGIDACPAGVNILRGDRIDVPQDEIRFLCEEPGLAINVNTPDDRLRAEEFLLKRDTKGCS